MCYNIVNEKIGGMCGFEKTRTNEYKRLFFTGAQPWDSAAKNEQGRNENEILFSN